jgi:4-diphosphocytidyl-2-C-methyl-D-erythritol kinase
MTTRRATLRSLAKVNLDLRVLHKRADGYHELRTVFQTISLADRIDVEYEPGRQTAILLDDPLAIPENLVVRAVEALQIRGRVRIRLRKRIPMGAGLGGGSSNAAAVLLGLPVLAGCKMPPERLHEIAASLGSDVPFFLSGGTTLGLGRGEELYPLPDLKAEPVIVVSTGLHVSTRHTYQNLARGLTFPSSSRSINSFQAFVRTLGEGRSARQASALSANDFEPVVFRQYPQLRTIRDKLSKLGSSGVGAARMTGSGSAIFAILGSAEERAHACKVLERDRVFGNCEVIPASLVSRRRYRQMWRRQLRDHAVSDVDLWPPQSRYAR